MWLGLRGSWGRSSSDTQSSAAQWPPGYPGPGQQGPAQPPHRQLLWPSGSRSYGICQLQLRSHFQPLQVRPLSGPASFCPHLSVPERGIRFTLFKPPRLWPLPIVASSPPQRLAPPLDSPLSRAWASAPHLYPLYRVHLEQNESAWGRLWLEVPDSAAPDSVVTVTVSATGREASPVAPTYAFLRLLVLAPAPQVRRPHFPSLGRLGKGKLNLGADTLTVSPSSTQDQLAAPAHSSGPVLTTASPAFHPSSLVTPDRAGGGLASNPWWGTLGGVLLLLGLASW